jgi:hypothetical protein
VTASYPPANGQHCSCGRLAMVLIPTEKFGPVPWCGLNDVENRMAEQAALDYLAGGADDGTADLVRRHRRSEAARADGQPDVIGAYLERGWTIDDEGRWHEPGDVTAGSGKRRKTGIPAGDNRESACMSRKPKGDR